MPKKKLIISVALLAKRAGYSHHVRLLKNLNGELDTLTVQEKNKLSNILYQDVASIFEKFGFKLPPPQRIDKKPKDSNE